MKKILFHQNGKLFNNAQGNFAFRVPVDVVDSLLGKGYLSLQLTTSNPTDQRGFQQNCLHIGGDNKLFWERQTSIIIANGTVVSVPFQFDQVKQYVQVKLKIIDGLFSLDIIDLDQDIPDYHAEVTFDMMPIMCFEIQVIGWGVASTATFMKKISNPNENAYSYYLEAKSDTDLKMNILDSEADFNSNLKALNIGDYIVNGGVLSAETSNLTSKVLTGTVIEMTPE